VGERRPGDVEVAVCEPGDGAVDAETGFEGGRGDVTAGQGASDGRYERDAEVGGDGGAGPKSIAEASSARRWAGGPRVP
jgi:hypothetical protein